MASSFEEEFMKVYDAHADAIFRYCYFRIYSRDKAKDIAQEAFLKAWQYIKDGKEVKNLRALVYKIANNLIIDEVRKKKESSLEALEEEGYFPPSEDKKMSDEYMDALTVKEVLQTLDEEYRDVVYMRYIENLQPREIAEVLGESVNVISVRIHRGVKKLKQALQENRKL